MSMTSPTITFDRLAYIDRLKEAGFDDKQARAQADALDAALRDSVATKADLENVKRELETKIETTAASLKVDILRWLVVTQIALAGFVFAIMKAL
jgi:DNA-binding transcriptional MerR regulator